MSTVIKKQQLIDWYNSINNIRAKENISLGSVSVPNSSQITAKATDFNALISAINALKSNTYLSYADWELIPSAVNKDNIAKDQSRSNTNDMLSSLSAICANYVVETTVNGMPSFATSSYKVETATFSTTSNVNDGNTSNKTTSNSTYSTNSTTSFSPNTCKTSSNSTSSNQTLRYDNIGTCATNSTNRCNDESIFSTNSRFEGVVSNKTSSNTTFTNSTFNNTPVSGNSTNTTTRNTTSNSTNSVSTFATRSTAFSVRG